MFSYVKLILLKIQNSLMLGTVSDSSTFVYKNQSGYPDNRVLKSIVLFDSGE